MVIAGQGRVSDGPSTTVERVVVDTAAHTAGLQAGDKIVAVDGVRIDDWDDAEVQDRGERW